MRQLTVNAKWLINSYFPCLRGLTCDPKRERKFVTHVVNFCKNALEVSALRMTTGVIRPDGNTDNLSNTRCCP